LSEGSEPPPRGGLIGAFLKHPWAFGIVAGLILIPAIRPCLVFEKPPAPVTGRLPELSLRDATGAPITLARLEGKVWVVALGYTRDPTPTTAEALARLAQRAGTELGDAGFLWITVDPGHDLPETLAAWAEKRGYTRPRWLLATGSQAEVLRVVADGLRFFLTSPVGDPPRIEHSRSLALVDRAGRVRGSYPITDEGLQEVGFRVATLMAEVTPP
jgi:cytochrome oxidase Cu insertion factor (SCO1/SenC/PrrC family)